MTGLVFVDTNVVIYTRDQGEPEKARKATEWIKALRANDDLVVSPQVINEAFAVSLWKFKEIGRDVIRDWIRHFLPFCTAPLDANVVSLALDLEETYSLQWWDSVLVASAISGNCRYLLTEDMQHRQIVRTVRIIDPFRTDLSDVISIS